MSKKPRRPLSVAPEVAAQWGALNGGTYTETEHEVFHDSVLYPDLPPVVMERDEVTPILVPARLLPATCPDCGGEADLSHPDPLAFHHRTERCEVAAEEESLKRSDLKFLARVIARGGDKKHRIAAPVEKEIIEDRGLILPPGAFTTLIALPHGDRARRWAELSHEPALQPRLTER